MNRFRKSALTVAISIAIACVAPLVAAHGDAHKAAAKKAISTEIHPWGQEGDAKRITRTITISMTDNMRFTPDNIRVKVGDTIKFIVKNRGAMLHEMVIGTEAELAKHAELMKKHPNMEHEEPYMAHVAAKKSATLIWKFTNPGDFMFACLIPGHYEAGMKGRISVAPAATSKKPATTSSTTPPTTSTNQGTNMKPTLAAVATAAVIAVSPAAAHPTHPVAAPATAEKASGKEAQPEMVNAEVKKIDAENKKITLKHEEIKSLDMPSMTMVFRVNDAKTLDGVKVGDKIKINVERVKSNYVVTRIEAVK